MRLGRGPKDSRDTPDMLRRGMWLPCADCGVSSAVDDVVEPGPPCRLRTVPVEGT